MFKSVKQLLNFILSYDTVVYEIVLLVIHHLKIVFSLNEYVRP